MKEVWKDVVGYEGLYEISSFGRLKSLPKIIVNCNGVSNRYKERIMKVNPDGSGYLCCRIRKNKIAKTVKIHILVAQSFLNYKPNGKVDIVVDHINGVKTDNNLGNLQIISHRENISKDKMNKTSKYSGVSWAKRDKKWRASININYTSISLGCFKSEKVARAVYEMALENECLFDGNVQNFKKELGLHRVHFSSKMRGVSFDNQKNKWRIRPIINGVKKSFGYAETEKKAIDKLNHIINSK
jgi:hypothetical protein